MKKRIFIGVDLPDPIRTAVAGYIAGLTSLDRNAFVRWEKPEKLHLTLKFLGEIDEGLISPIGSALEKVMVRQRPFECSLGGTGVFPGPARPRIFWLGIKKGNAELSSVAVNVDNAAAGLGFEREKRNFKPHLTIGRVRSPERSGKVANLHLGRSFETPSFQIGEVLLFESRLTNLGSIYSVESRHRLIGDQAI